MTIPYSTLVRAVGAAVLLALVSGSAVAQQTQGTFADDLDGPFRITQAANGTVVVTEGRAREVTSFSATGTDRKRIAEFSNAQPSSVLALPDGTLLVGVRGTSQGSVFRIDESKVGTDGFSTITANNVGIPRDFVRLADGRVLLVAGSSGSGSTEGRVISLNADGTIENGSFITGLADPSGIARLADNRLLITETGGGGRVRVFNSDGTNGRDFVTDVGAPSDVLQLADGRVLVVDQSPDPAVASGGAVRIYEADGTGGKNFATGLVQPTGLLQTTAGDVLIGVFGGDATDAGSIERFSVTPPTSQPVGPALASIGTPYPNPAGRSATLDVSVNATQNVRVAVYDVLGRELALVHEAPLAAGLTVSLALPTASLVPGTYIVRVEGEDFSEVRRLTVAR